jgi:hypothetical protein
MKHSSSTASATVTALFGPLTATIAVAATIAALAPAAHAQGTPFGERAGGGGSDAPAPQPPPPAAEETSPASPVRTTLLTEFYRLNAQRDAAIRSAVSKRSAADKSALASIRKKAGQDYNFLALTQGLEEVIENGGTWIANLEWKKSYEKEFTSLKINRDIFIEKEEERIFQAFKQQYDALGKKAVASSDYSAAGKIFAEIKIFSPTSTTIVGRWRSSHSGKILTFRSDHIIDSAEGWRQAWRVVRQNGKLTIVPSDAKKEWVLSDDFKKMSWFLTRI